jgi:RNA polymerase sigma-70 factor (ECF subfamily)
VESWRCCQRGLSWLARSAAGSAFSRYHAEAGVAAEHCLAPSFEQTRWDRIALAHWRDPAAGLVALQGLEPPSWLAGSYMWAAVLSDLHRRCGHHAEARRYREVAIGSAPSRVVKDLLGRRLGDERRRWAPGDE